MVGPIDQLAQPSPLNLARRSLCQLVEDQNAPWNLERGKLTLQELAKLSSRRLRVGIRNDRGCNVFAKAGMKNGKGRSFGYSRMAQQRGLDLRRGDLLTATVDHLAQAPVQR